jgi:homoserine O-succinyltransferase/O-acetyltransferase
MNFADNKSIRIAILDLNDGKPNQGMRCIREIVNQFADHSGMDVEWDEFDVRVKLEVPDTSYDIFISSGGPGSPLESKGSDWENRYFNWIASVVQWNNNPANPTKKFVFFICHSYQLACRYFQVGSVCARRSTAFGVFPIHLMPDGRNEEVFNGLNDPFYAVDSRDFQVVQPDHAQLQQMGASILAIEKERPHVALERAVMAIRFNPYMIGTQFHPEADAIGMTLHLQSEDKKKTVVENYGYEKWCNMIEHLNDPEKILWTYSHILPNFLNIAVEQLVLVES